MTFSIEYEGADQVQEAWLEYQYHAPHYKAGAVIVVMREGEYFDLDTGTLTANLTAGSEFQLHEGDDVYMDDYLPVNGTHVGWNGAAFSGKAGCEATLKSVFPQTFDWSGMKDSYLCYTTTEGREGWLKFSLWVGLPLNERRLEFYWTTYQ